MLSQDVDKALKEMQARNAHWQQKLALLHERVAHRCPSLSPVQHARTHTGAGAAS